MFIFASSSRNIQHRISAVLWSLEQTAHEVQFDIELFSFIVVCLLVCLHAKCMKAMRVFSQHQQRNIRSHGHTDNTKARNEHLILFICYFCNLSWSKICTSRNLANIQTRTRRYIYHGVAKEEEKERKTGFFSPATAPN